MNKVANIVANRSAEFIFIPDRNESEEIAERFFRKYNFPNVIGLIDGTQIKIKKPRLHEGEKVC